MPTGFISFYKQEYMDQMTDSDGNIKIPGPLYVKLIDDSYMIFVEVYTSKQQVFSSIISASLGNKRFAGLDGITVYYATKGIEIARIPGKQEFSIKLDIIGHYMVPIEDKMQFLRDIFDSSKEIQNNFEDAKRQGNSQCVFFKNPIYKGRDGGCGASLMDIAKQQYKVNMAWLHWCMKETDIRTRTLSDTILDAQGVNVLQDVLLPKVYRTALALLKDKNDTFSGYFQVEDVTVNLM